MPVDYHQSAEGLRAVIRECRPTDLPELVEGLASLSSESRIARFFYDKHSFLPAELVQLALPNDRDHWILVAVLADPDGREQIVGLARCVRLGGTSTADFAIVIRDGFTQSGFGTQLVLGSGTPPDGSASRIGARITSPTIGAWKNCSAWLDPRSGPKTSEEG